jgi:Raf kinase inhibitor-like YbhB/YbcL family protein
MRRALVATLIVLAGCGGGGQKVSGPPPAAPEKITLSSSAFQANSSIPKQFTCDGQNVSPPLSWTGVPQGARSLALLLEDPDAPGGTFVHWSLYGIDSKETRIAQGKNPPGATEGANSFGDTGYGGPCPPKGGGPHHYVFTLYALKARLGLQPGASPKAVRSSVGTAALARGQLTATYGR